MHLFDIEVAYAGVSHFPGVQLFDTVTWHCHPQSSHTPQIPHQLIRMLTTLCWAALVAFLGCMRGQGQTCKNILQERRDFIEPAGSASA